MRMAKMQVYLPADLHERVKARGDALNVSGVLQRALEEELATLARREALGEEVRAYEARRGSFTDDEVAALAARDRAEAEARRRRSRRRTKTRAA
jgi:post-segregation antitoxin (ccd killing protein)